MRTSNSSPYIHNDAERLMKEARFLSITYPHLFRFSVGFTQKEQKLYPQGYIRLSGENGFPLQRFGLLSEDVSPDIMAWSRTNQFSEYQGFWNSYYDLYKNAQEEIRKRAKSMPRAEEHFALEAWLRFFKVYHLTNMHMVKTTAYLVPTPKTFEGFDYDTTNIDQIHLLQHTGIRFSDKVKILSIVKDSPMTLHSETAQGILDLPEQYLQELFGSGAKNIKLSEGCYGYIFRYQPWLDI